MEIIGCDDTGVKLIVPPVLPELDANHPRAARTLEVLSQALAQGRGSVNAKMWGYRAEKLLTPGIPCLLRETGGMRPPDRLPGRRQLPSSHPSSISV